MNGNNTITHLQHLTWTVGALGMTRCLPVRTTLHMADIEENPNSRAPSTLSRPDSAPSVHSLHSNQSQDASNKSSATSSSVRSTSRTQQGTCSQTAECQKSHGRFGSSQAGPSSAASSTASKTSTESKTSSSTGVKSRIPVPMNTVCKNGLPFGKEIVIVLAVEASWFRLFVETDELTRFSVVRV